MILRTRGPRRRGRDVNSSGLSRVYLSRGQGMPGSSGATTLPAAGQLWLGIHDDHCGDDRGQFRVQIHATR